VRLAAEAEKAIAVHTADGGPGASEVYIRLKTILELQTILCTEYRYARLPTVTSNSVLIHFVEEIHTLPS
jgi:hypothetical protein